MANALDHRARRSRWQGTSMGSITLDLKPGLALGPFTLGIPICEAFAYIEQNPSIYDVVHVKYHDEEPLMLDLVVSFPDHGFHLRFESSSQRLRLIEVFDVQRLQMRYANSFIGGPNTLATFVAVYAVCGPTFPGSYDVDRGMYTLFYPGLSFAFPIPPLYKDYLLDRKAELPLEFPDGTTPVTSRVCIYDKSSGSNIGVGVGALLKKAVPPPLPVGSLYMEVVHAKLDKEIWFTVGGQHIPFGASPQDVWSELGIPCGIHQKQTHKIKKFVLHTNFPGHADFNSYIKCNFMIQCPPSFTEQEEANTHEHCITSNTKWSQVQELLGDAGRAAIQTQGSTINPFGSTFVYGYRNIAFEVMRNGHIATVTLFQS
ncbi:PHAF1 protein At3g51130 isoform X2 [Cryptomeria japonica]|uniref:PHAF1 protein At3g51130 isoform X2 n=1 Tax=Cryptomeria japonica TaxID=3369 RepID=UPI0027DA7312|nr:PHAF1 protein At3g51130 isoform X2 [Cryptomeria japonica]